MSSAAAKAAVRQNSQDVEGRGDFDFVIVGAGSAGCVVAPRLDGPKTLTLETLPVPEVGPDEILIQIDSVDVAGWEPFEREGLGVRWSSRVEVAG